jgi:hypothetical protein
MRKNFFLMSSVLAVFLMAVLLGGCGSSKKEGAADPTATPSLVSNDTCTNSCHAGSVDPVTGQSIVASWNASVHKQEGVECQGCHGAGSQHYGVGPLPYPNPDPKRCGTCHSAIFTAYSGSRHAEGEIESGKLCNRCHTHNGAILSDQSGYTGDANFLKNYSTTIAPPRMTEEEAGHIRCTTCHFTHQTDQLRTVYTMNGATKVAWQPSTFVGSVNASTNAQYQLCTSCHSYINPNGTLVASGTTASGTSPFYHNTRWYRMIASTHWDNPATGTTAAGTTVEGYVLRTNGPNAANPCFDCHGHEAKTGTRQDETPPRPSTAWTDWAKSAHAGKLLYLKYSTAAKAPNRTTTQVDKVVATGTNDTYGIGWTHYNWDDNASRGSCQRCHTATGASNFMKNPSGYNAANNDFSHLANWAASGGSPQQEILYCWGCHSNAAAGVLYQPGALSFTYTNGATVTYPDVKGSNVCMSCHTGRETGDSIKNDPDADGTRSFINSHYLAAGGQLFGTTGYEYDGAYGNRSYTNPAYFQHDKIGLASAPGTGVNGPCVGCHMSTPNKHLFLPVAKNESTGAITAILSTVCVVCHSGQYALTPASLTTEEEDYQASLDALKAALASKGIYFYNAHPYFYTAPYVVGGTNTAYTTWATPYGYGTNGVNWKNTMGAAFNANLLIHDPGGYVHNRIYSKRLIWDSIDWIDNGILDNSTPTTLPTLGLSAGTLAEAQAYLGTTRP